MTIYQLVDALGDELVAVPHPPPPICLTPLAVRPQPSLDNEQPMVDLYLQADMMHTDDVYIGVTSILANRGRENAQRRC